ISAARSLDEEAASVDPAPAGEAWAVLRGLTPAERRGAQPAAPGMSYKEIARQLNRSFSTIDHQLRSVRQKLGVRSTGRLARLPARHPPAPGTALPPHAARGS